ncbi:MAG: type II toxin-antitoxin system RelE/ParE family toxin [Azonexus sp.]|jgi:plasmid stabilization system protein ParE|nr:type II toxin-antitoxin system RelE/ParE family toxin [Azonexus sp.]
MIYTVEFSPQAREDLHRLYAFLLDKTQTVEDLNVAERALAAIATAVDTHLAKTPSSIVKPEAAGACDANW